MRKLIRIVVFLTGAITAVQAQQAPIENLGVYKEAVELFDKGKYTAAKQRFGTFIQRNQASETLIGGNDLVAEAEFYQALSAFNLLNANAAAMFEAFAAKYPHNTRVDEAWFYIGKLRYIKKDYTGAVAPLRKVEAGNLTREQVVETRFMLGYGYYKKGEMREAMGKFRQIRQSPGTYGEMGAYFFAVIAYENENYDEAYTALQRVDANAKYAKNLELMKASCLLALKRYDDLDAMGEDLAANSKRAGSETWFILGNAAFDRDKYAKCIEYFTSYEQNRGRLNREGQYRMAYSLYQEKDYEGALKRFNRTLRPEDAVAQNAYYYLGHTYLKVEKFENARTAFQKASSLEFDEDLKGEALFQYAKVSFETRYFEDALGGLQTYLNKHPDSEYADEAKSLIGEVLLYTNNYKEAIEYLEASGGLRTERSQRAYQRACFYYALSMYDKRKYEISGSFFKKAYNQRRDPEITLASYFWYGESLFRQQDYRGANTAYRSFLNQPYASKNPNYAMAWYGIGWSNLKQEDYDEAGKNFEKFIGLADRKRNKEEYVDAVLRAGDCEFA
ncbi:MAG TPA: tetratricopeptide repeat protein, partial [Bacteroidetes bacterium]|nr:tetratricopeptide repeat protein [Bacteroidota bacterium]